MMDGSTTTSVHFFGIRVLDKCTVMCVTGKGGRQEGQSKAELYRGHLLPPAMRVLYLVCLFGYQFRFSRSLNDFLTHRFNYW